MHVDQANILKQNSLIGLFPFNSVMIRLFYKLCGHRSLLPNRYIFMPLRFQCFNNSIRTLCTPYSSKTRYKSVKSLEELKSDIVKICRDYDRLSSDNVDKLNENSHFINDMQLDSLDHVEIVVQVEDNYGIEIPDDLEDATTPAELANIVWPIIQDKQKREYDYDR
ncbi:hypothetical protein GJ496_011080 [Pomphorhynchus laevis]|nr:hypothetical protein GJ496_011080 [Pomphorhynchus laevis]